MAGEISTLTALSSPADGDLVEVVDVSDPTYDAAGTNKKGTLSTLRTYMQTGVSVDQVSERLYGYSGTLVTGAGVARIYFTRNVTITNVFAWVGTAPTGASVICDVNRNGTTIFTTQSARPTISAGSTTDLTSTPAVTAITSGQYLTVDIDQVGSTFAGADLVLGVEFTEAIS